MRALKTDLHFKAGIYVILIVVSGTILYYYIGSSIDIFPFPEAHVPHSF